MKKFVALAALLAMVVLVVGAPALAQPVTVDPNTPVSEVPAEGLEAPLPAAPLPAAPLPEVAPAAAPLPEAPLPEAPLPEAPLPEAPLPEVAPAEAPLLEAPLPEPATQQPEDGVAIDPGTTVDREEEEEADQGTDVQREAGSGAKVDRGTDDQEEAGSSSGESVRGAQEERKAADSRAAQRLNRDGEDDDEDDEDDDDPEQGEIEQEAETGDIEQEAEVINTGDNVNQCVGILQAANTGSNQNAQGVIQENDSRRDDDDDDDDDDEVEIEDAGNLTITPELVVDCRQTILQVVMAERKTELLKGAKGKALRRALDTSVVRGGGRVSPKTLRASAAGQPRGVGAAARGGRLPRTGGISVGEMAALMGLSGGALLIGGGLLVRRVSR